MLYFFYIVLFVIRKVLILIIKPILYPNTGLDFHSEVAIKPLLNIYFDKYFNFGCQSDFNNIITPNNIEVFLGFSIALSFIFLGACFLSCYINYNTPEVLDSLTEFGFDSWDPTSLLLSGSFLWAVAGVVQYATCYILFHEVLKLKPENTLFLKENILDF